MFNKNILVKENIRITDAFKALDETAEKVLFVVDDEGRLLGSLTDGDIRRYLLKGRSLEDTIADVYNRNPKYIYKNEYSNESAKNILLKYRISLIPIINEHKKLIEVVPWDTLFSKDSKKIKRRINRINVPVVIMAGGKGTRLNPFTKILPKPLIPIGDKPIIEIIMDKFHEYGMENFYVTLNHRSKMIKAYFEEFKAQYRITYIYEDKPLGTAGGLKYLPDKVAGPVFVSNSDIIIEEDYRKILKFHRSNKNEITIVASIKNYNIPYGICEIEDGGVLHKISEKPNFSFLVNTGMYVINTGALSVIPKNEFYHITQLIGDVKSMGKKVGIFPVSEKAWIDIGEWGKYKEALEHFRI
jgi:dTDP-glucose pyrophosphorylase